jgi:hypothetical protein
MHMATLSENGLEIYRRFPRMFQEEPELFAWGAFIGREGVTAVVVLNQQGQEAHKLGFFRGAGLTFAD